MCNCGRAEADDGAERGGEFDAVSPGGEAGVADAVEDENEGGDGGGEEDEEDITVGFDTPESVSPATVSQSLALSVLGTTVYPRLFYVTIGDADVFIATKT
jgi:hypothetical protein